VTRAQAAPEGAPPCVGPRRAAEILGVTERTILRWSDDGTLAVQYRTAGGHRRYSLAYLELIAQETEQAAG
jgi:DNA-binding transcriptional MerR regulator